VKGAELYDVAKDRAQARDVAGEFPGVVAAMREHYEGWWEGLEPILDEFVPISIGAEQQPVVVLTSGDWEGIYADNTGFVREAVGGPTGGHWNLTAERAGRYRFTLRRWPERANVGVGEAYLPTPESPIYRPGLVTKAFPEIAGARVEMGGESASAVARPEETGVVLSLTLPAGPARFKAWFVDAEREPECAAYFVTVEYEGP
jgi:hypothetical protein